MEMYGLRSSTNMPSYCPLSGTNCCNILWLFWGDVDGGGGETARWLLLLKVKKPLCHWTEGDYELPPLPFRQELFRQVGEMQMRLHMATISFQSHQGIKNVFVLSKPIVGWGKRSRERKLFGRWLSSESSRPNRTTRTRPYEGKKREQYIYIIFI